MVSPWNVSEKSARLCIDQRDDFFFDHPLDHLSGICLVTVVNRFIQSVVFDYEKNLGVRYYVASMQTCFTKYTEIEDALDLNAFVEDINSREARLHFSISQKQALTCHGTAVLSVWSEGEAGEVLDREGLSYGPERIDGCLVHKVLEKNVLISDHLDEGGRYKCRVVLPERPHILDGGELLEVPLLFEAVRQFQLSLMHKVEDIPLKARMILSDMELNLSRPVTRFDKLWIDFDKKQKIENKTSNKFAFTWKCGILCKDQSVGTCSAKYFIVSEERYWKLRNRSSAQKGGNQ
ncbi:MAG: hypothetical protein LBS02_11985 [Hungatella sp.]|nr:hypothetical protein [Hungatella sp.]